jgi:hypothetical protein
MGVLLPHGCPTPYGFGDKGHFLMPTASPQMARTRDRVLVRAQLTSLHALSFAVASASVGAAMLLLGVNSLVAGREAFNFKHDPRQSKVWPIWDKS